LLLRVGQQSRPADTGILPVTMTENTQYYLLVFKSAVFPQFPHLDADSPQKAMYKTFLKLGHVVKIR